jgi:hypothetical protein
VERKNSWQIAEYTGHPAPYRFQHLLGPAAWVSASLKSGSVGDHVTVRW